MDNTSSGEFQRVFTWRWRSPENQTIFDLSVDELERLWSRTRDDLRTELDADRDLARPRPQLDLPYPEREREGPGGRTHREPPQLELLVACTPRQRTRCEEIKTEGFESASPEELAQRLHWLFTHRGRPKGLSPLDYGAQRELTVARSLTWGFFTKSRETPGFPVQWRARFGDAAAILGLLLWARRLGRSGVTLSGPQGCSVLDCGIATWWRYLKTLEKSGYLIRLRRWKPGKGGRPVASAANWYGFGPRALAELAKIEGKLEPQAATLRAFQRCRRARRRTEGRRRGVDLLPGYRFPSLVDYVSQAVHGWQAAEQVDARRWADFQVGTPPSDYTTASRPVFIFELGGDDVQQLRRLDDLDDLDQDVAVGTLVPGVCSGGSPDRTGEVGVDRHPVGRNDAPPGGLTDRPVEQALELLTDRHNIAAAHESKHAGHGGEGHRVCEVSLRERQSRVGGHAVDVARARPPITRPGEKAFAERRANSRPGAVGVVSGRNSRDLRSTIPISPRIGSPEEGEMSLRTGPSASQTRPPPPPPKPATGPAAAQGPPREAISAKDTGHSHAIEPPEVEAALIARHPYLAKMPVSIRAIWLARLLQ